jgi:hypothetical protein
VTVGFVGGHLRYLFLVPFICIPPYVIGMQANFLAFRIQIDHEEFLKFGVARCCLGGGQDAICR